MNLRDAFLEAILSSDLNREQKLKLRLAFCVPAIRDAILDSLEIEAKADWEKIIETIIEALPEIIALIELLFELFE